MSNPITQPEHYTQHPSGIECIEIARLLPGALSHAVTYIWRAGLKIDPAFAPPDIDGEPRRIRALAASGAQDVAKSAFWIRDYGAAPLPVVNPGKAAALLYRAAESDRRVVLTLLSLSAAARALRPLHFTHDARARALDALGRIVDAHIGRAELCHDLAENTLAKWQRQFETVRDREPA